MRFLYVLFLLLWLPWSAVAQSKSSDACLQVASWNIANLGQSKDDEEINTMAQVLRRFDVVAIQEVVAGPAGPQAVARLADALNRTGAAWDYVISPPTVGNGVERYAFLWKKHRVKLAGKAQLVDALDPLMDREPYYAKFSFGPYFMSLISFHAVPKSKDPASEIVHLPKILTLFPNDALIIMGDFNLPHHEKAFQGLREKDMDAALRKTKTTLKMEPDPETGERRANAYDNLFFEQKELRLDSAGAIDFSYSFPTLKAARLVSDHLPVWGCFCAK
jgi:deoxyribonuclease-1-like protein